MAMAAASGWHTDLETDDDHRRPSMDALRRTLEINHGCQLQKTPPLQKDVIGKVTLVEGDITSLDVGNGPNCFFNPANCGLTNAAGVSAALERRFGTQINRFCEGKVPIGGLPEGTILKQSLKRRKRGSIWYTYHITHAHKG